MIRKIKIAMVTLSLAIMFLASGCGTARVKTQVDLIPTSNPQNESKDEKLLDKNIDLNSETESLEEGEIILTDLTIKPEETIFKFVGKNIESFYKTAKFKLLFVKICTEVDLSSVLLSVEMHTMVPFTSDDGIIHTEESESLDNFYCPLGKLYAEIIINFDYLGETVKISESTLTATIKRVDEEKLIATFTLELTKDVSLEIICNLRQG